ncbi:hypothetical protein CERZMDRAFT_97681 [Cercospora zeae-maydis SCOH1-5]|uniref:MARVEL domain-containing protein n=1 Tax=Cercospora zeae-maydis SCOH1-5 TaxID=717836 RepID=A0A6A6FGN7_9PEZI|nr:hypothetical protein CERZMDRAFT_97681 [Cercospora zeae-maydis SCOH1-5]
MSQTLTLGRGLIVLGNVAYSLGAFVADFNETHVLNPRWPPHAKFHNGQTMTLGVLLASMSTYFLFRPTLSFEQTKDNLWAAATIGSFYCAAGLCAILYPGTAWQDPEFPGNGEQRYVFGGVCILMWLGYWLEARKLPRNKSA